jgi:hypothetical protein
MLVHVIRFLLTLIVVGIVIFVGATVPMGKRTFFGHVRAIWATDEAKDMREGVGEKTAPMVDKVKRGVEAGYREATKAPDATPPAHPTPTHP